MKYKQKDEFHRCCDLNFSYNLKARSIMFIYDASLTPSPNLLTEVRKKKIFKLICAMFVFPYVGFSDITLINHTVLKGHDLNFTYINILVFPLSGRLF